MLVGNRPIFIQKGESKILGVFRFATWRDAFQPLAIKRTDGI